MKALLVAALPREVRPFLRRVTALPGPQDLGLPAWEFALRGEGAPGAAAVVLAGMGPEAAARAAARALAHWRPGVLISLGFSGALTPDLPPGAVVLGESFWQYAPESGNLKAVSAPRPPRPLPELVGRLRHAGLPAFTGSLVTTPFIIHKASQGGPLKALPRPVLDMETAPLAEVAAARGLVFVGLRAVTDGAGEEIPEFLRESGRGEPGLGAALAWIGAKPRRVLPLVRLWRRSRMAARRLARALEVLLPLLP